MDHRTALYYPFIHFPDDEWVKLAALYWNRIARIVPPGYTTHDSPVVKAFGDSFVHNLKAKSMGESNVAYLLRLEEGLTPQTLLGHIRAQVKGFLARGSSA
jgi:hypothetical protein